jgi:Fe-S oxidoreductase
MAYANTELLNEVAPKRMVTTCPHCLHTIKNEYPDFGGHYEIVHHTQFINELIQAGQIKLKAEKNQKYAFHDPCYLGRHNGIIADPRYDLARTTTELVELPRHARKSFCCGAGGAQMWKEEEHGTQRVNANRFHEAELLDLDTLAVSCPFCMIMINDASKDAKSDIHVMDVAEIVLASMERS